MRISIAIGCGIALGILVTGVIVLFFWGNVFTDSIIRWLLTV